MLVQKQGCALRLCCGIHLAFQTHKAKSCFYVIVHAIPLIIRQFRILTLVCK